MSGAKLQLEVFIYLPFLFITSLSQAIAFSEADVVDVVKYFTTPECRAWREQTVVHDMDLVSFYPSPRTFLVSVDCL